MSCVSLESVLIPNSESVVIGPYAFSRCEKLKSFAAYNYDNPTSSNMGIGWLCEWAFCLCESLECVILPDSILHIESCAFGICKSLKSIHLPKNLFTIGEMSFYSCENLATIELPDTVYAVYKNAFLKCPSLKTIKCSNPNALADAKLRKAIKII